MDELCQFGFIVSFTAFNKLSRKNIRRMSTKTLLQCLCEYCINVQCIFLQARVS